MAKKKVEVIMNKKCGCECGNSCGKQFHAQCGSSGAIYFFGFLGAAIYYISTATGFWMGVLGFLKAIVWPVFLVLKLLTFLGA